MIYKNQEKHLRKLKLEKKETKKKNTEKKNKEDEKWKRKEANLKRKKWK